MEAAKEKVCKQCGESKELSFFYKSKSCLLGVNSRCKECVKLNNRIDYSRNSSKWAETRERWRSENKERIKRNTARYNSENREQIRRKQRDHRKENPEHYREKSRRRKKDPEKQRAWDQARRARENAAAGRFTSEQFKSRLDYYGGSCVYCGSTEDITIDHRIPLSRGGANWPANLVPACKTCNCSKGAKTELEFRKLISEEKE